MNPQNLDQAEQELDRALWDYAHASANGEARDQLTAREEIIQASLHVLYFRARAKGLDMPRPTVYIKADSALYIPPPETPGTQK